MRISVILGHPEPGSFNHAIAEAAVEALTQNGHDVSFHDLYAERFDPILPGPETPRDGPRDHALPRYYAEPAAADATVLTHPPRWGVPPGAAVVA